MNMVWLMGRWGRGGGGEGGPNQQRDNFWRWRGRQWLCPPAAFPSFQRRRRAGNPGQAGRRSLCWSCVVHADIISNAWCRAVPEAWQCLVLWETSCGQGETHDLIAGVMTAVHHWSDDSRGQTQSFWPTLSRLLGRLPPSSCLRLPGTARQRGPH